MVSSELQGELGEVMHHLDPQRQYLLNGVATYVDDVREDGWFYLWGIQVHDCAPVLRVEMPFTDELDAFYKILLSIRLTPGLLALTHFDEEAESILVVGDHVIMGLSDEGGLSTDPIAFANSIREGSPRSNLLSASTLLDGVMHEKVFYETFAADEFVTEVVFDTLETKTLLTIEELDISDGI